MPRKGWGWHSPGNHKCVDCGVSLADRHWATERCFDCAEKHKKEVAREYYMGWRGRRSGGVP